MAVETERQTILPLRTAVRIAWRNIRVRWWRSMLVTSGIVLSLAFLTYVLYSGSMVRHAAALGTVSQVGTVDSIPGGESEDTNIRIQTYWMIGLALLISFVGILNAMVMNVTERFREIGTMKCLGALDSLIIKLYLIESMFQGLGGTMAGIITGCVLALGEGWIIYGSRALLLVPIGELVGIVGTSLIAGVMLSVGGALYPAWVAAKMKPVDAMRSEM